MNKNTGAQQCVPHGCPLAIVYAPQQDWNATYDPELGLERGTIFPELDKPFLAGVE